MIDFSKVDLRTEKEKELDEECRIQGEEYLKLLQMPGATKQRAINYLANHYGVTEMTMRSHLVRAGVYEFGKRQKKA